MTWLQSAPDHITLCSAFQVWNQYWLCGLPMVCKALLFLATSLLMQVEIIRLKPIKFTISEINTNSAWYKDMIWCWTGLNRFPSIPTVHNGVSFLVTLFPTKTKVMKTDQQCWLGCASVCWTGGTSLHVFPSYWQSSPPSPPVIKWDRIQYHGVQQNTHRWKI